MKRRLSLLVFAFALVVPPFWADRAIRLDAEAQLAAHGWVCGNPAMGIAVLAAILIGALSAIALCLNVWAILAVGQKPSAWRWAEVAVIGGPVLGNVGLVAYILSLGG